jgi:hypothetical protein
MTATAPANAVRRPQRTIVGPHAVLFEPLAATGKLDRATFFRLRQRAAALRLAADRLQAALETGDRGALTDALEALVEHGQLAFGELVDLGRTR